jgi:hypothetical protein
MTTVLDAILTGRRDRLRFVYNPIGDTFGALCYINAYVLVELSRKTSSFCYRETSESVELKLGLCSYPGMGSIDMDASANETNQHYENKNVIDTYLIECLEEKLHLTFDAELSPRLVE